MLQALIPIGLVPAAALIAGAPAGRVALLLCMRHQRRDVPELAAAGPMPYASQLKTLQTTPFKYRSIDCELRKLPVQKGKAGERGTRHNAMPYI